MSCRLGGGVSPPVRIKAISTGRQLYGRHSLADSAAGSSRTW